ncbi:hypothetical protein FOCC_FOCC011357 [Frankliniella occidentalis]|nr:hypothetical protein FOCC_FOCC011357 [Frankliniella occidentalis]
MTGETWPSTQWLGRRVATLSDAEPSDLGARCDHEDAGTAAGAAPRPPRAARGPWTRRGAPGQRDARGQGKGHAAPVQVPPARPAAQQGPRHQPVLRASRRRAHRQVVTLRARLHAGPQDHLLLHGQGLPSARDHVVQGRHRAVLPQVLPGPRVAHRQRHHQVQNGNRPNDPEGLRFLRVPGQQPVRRGQQRLPDRL